MSEYDVRAIDPLKPYPPAFCCKVIPSARAGKAVHVNTWHRWRLQGRFEAIKIGERWFMRGAELLRFIHLQGPIQGPTPRSAAQRERDVSAARAASRALSGPRRRRVAQA